MRTREQVSLKGALHLLAKLGKTGTLVSDGRKSCAKRLMWNYLAHVDGCLSHRNNNKKPAANAPAIVPQSLC
jgi:hypothetical protein